MDIMWIVMTSTNWNNVKIKNHPMEIDLFPSDIRIDTALSLRRHLTIPKSIACTSRLLSHKLQIARYYRAAFFSTRYTRLYIRIKLFVFDPCGVLKLLPHNIFHFRCHCWSSKMTVVDENFYIQGNDRNFDESYDFAPCGLLYIDEHHAKSWNTRCIHDIWKTLCIQETREQEFQDWNFRKSVIPVSFSPVFIHHTKANQHQILNHRWTALCT